MIELEPTRNGTPPRVEVGHRWLRCARVIAVCTLGIGVAVGAIRTPAPANAPVDIRSVDTLMLRLMATDNVPGAALVLIKEGRIVLEKNLVFEIYRLMPP
jgi:hypothetical protein